MKYSTTQKDGYTLVETMVASAVVGIILVSIVIGGVSLQRTFAGSDGALKATADQSRILDYIARDLRQALTVIVSNSGQTLTLTMPAYLDQNTGNPVIPTVSAGASSSSGVVDYGDPASPLTVTYFPANPLTSPATTYTYQSNGQYLIRQVGATQTVISLDCPSLQINVADNTTSVSTSISFAPRFNFSNQANARAGSLVYGTTTFRNTRRN